MRSKMKAKYEIVLVPGDKGVSCEGCYYLKPYRLDVGSFHCTKASDECISNEAMNMVWKRQRVKKGASNA